jgi:cytochrome c peroxidase
MILSPAQILRVQHRYCVHVGRCVCAPALLALSLLAIAPSICRAADSQYLGLPLRGASAQVDHLSPESVLGMRLFFDDRLSGDRKISCATCHIPARGFADNHRCAIGIDGQRGTRNTPTLWNVAFMTSFFWDGRRSSLVRQALDPLFDPREMGLRSRGALLDAIKHDPSYRKAFHRAFGSGDDSITVEHVASAIASFEETLVAGDSLFDRYFYGHEPHAMSPAAIRGFELFRGRAGCATCHTITAHYALFTDNQFHDEGVGMSRIAPQLAAASIRVARTPPARLDDLVTSDPQVAALGRFVITRKPSDIGAFRTPTLRNVALTAPYMHDGSIPTLPQAVDFEIYYRSLRAKRPLILTPRERSDLVAFLRSLTSPAAAALAKPTQEPAKRVAGRAGISDALMEAPSCMSRSLSGALSSGISLWGLRRQWLYRRAGRGATSFRNQAQFSKRRAIDSCALRYAHRRAQFWIDHPPGNLRNRVGFLR